LYEKAASSPFTDFIQPTPHRYATAAAAAAGGGGDVGDVVTGL